MGDMSGPDDTLVSLEAFELSKGWSFRQTDDEHGDWLPVTKVPSTVHQDLIDNNRYVQLLSLAQSLTISD